MSYIIKIHRTTTATYMRCHENLLSGVMSLISNHTFDVVN